MELFNFLRENADAIFAIMFSAHALAVAIVNLTPTPEDNELVGKAYKIIEWMAGIFSYQAKQLPGEARFVDEELDQA